MGLWIFMVYWPGWLVVWKVFCEDWKLVEKWFCIIFKILKISEFWPLFHTKKNSSNFGLLRLSLSQNVKCKSSQMLITTWPIKKDVKWWQYITWCFGPDRLCCIIHMSGYIISIYVFCWEIWHVQIIRLVLLHEF